MIYVYLLGFWGISLLFSSGYAFYRGYSYSDSSHKIAALKVENQKAKLSEAYYKSAWAYATELNKRIEDDDKINKEIIDDLHENKESAANESDVIIDAEWMRELDRLH